MSIHRRVQSKPAFTKVPSRAPGNEPVVTKMSGGKTSAAERDKLGLAAELVDYRKPRWQAELPELLRSVNDIEEYVLAILKARGLRVNRERFGVYPGHVQTKGNGIAIELYEGIPQRILTPLGPTLGIDLKGGASASQVKTALKTITEKLGLVELKELSEKESAVLFQVTMDLDGNPLPPVAINTEVRLKTEEGLAIFKKVWAQPR